VQPRESRVPKWLFLQRLKAAEFADPAHSNDQPHGQNARKLTGSGPFHANILTL